MNEIYLLTGGNMGDRMQYLQSAALQVEKLIGRTVKRSSVYQTEAWGFTKQGAFLNQVLCLHSHLGPSELLLQLLQIERQLGRKRLEKMGPRVIDIDILFYGNKTVSTADLIIPHPRIAQRRFVLTPLNEIAPDFIHPVLNQPISYLLQVCRDQLEVSLYRSST